ncbi:MAG: restriction endonuclease subunit S, partial [Nostoc sp.]
MIEYREDLVKLPVLWSLAKISDIAYVKGGKRLPKGSQYSEIATNYPYIRVSDFKNGTVNLNDIRYICEEVHKKIAAYTISDKDIYISIAGTIGVVGLIPPVLNGANLTE